MKTIAAITLCILLALCPFARAAEWEDPVGQQITGVHAPYMTEDGKPSAADFFTDESFRENRITVINFWDSGCINCRIEMPDFELAYRNYREMGVGVLGVATRWIGGPYEQCITVLNELGVTYPNAFIDEGFEAFTAQCRHCPETFIADENGVVLKYYPGRIDYAVLEAGICQCIALRGDADGDGELSFSDVSALSYFVMNSAELDPLALAGADMDGDGKIGVLDISALYEFLLDREDLP